MAGAAGITFAIQQMHLVLPVLLTGLWGGLVLGLVITQAIVAKPGDRSQSLGLGLFVSAALVAVPMRLFVVPSSAWLPFGLLLASGVALVTGLRELANPVGDLCHEAIERAKGEDYPGLRLEWALLFFLAGGGIAMLLAAWQRRESLPSFGAGLWAGLWLGLLLFEAASRRRGPRMTAALGFAGIPVVAIPVRYFVWPVHAWLAWAGALAAMAALATALRLAWQIRVGAGSREGQEQDRTAADVRLREALTNAGPRVKSWSHDLLLKWAAGFLLIAAGLSAITFGREQGREPAIWVGIALLSLTGSVGLWGPGLYSRTSRFAACRITGQLAFWLSLLLLPLVEPGPSSQLPFTMRPSVRPVGLGIGLLLLGGAWFLQRTSILSHGSDPEPKHAIERPLSLLLVVASLLITLTGIELRQRDAVQIDAMSVVQTNIAGSSHFQTADNIRALRIVQPLPPLPIFTNYVEFADGSSYRVDSALYPDEDAFVTALRTAGHLNSQSFPQSNVELWARG